MEYIPYSVAIVTTNSKPYTPVLIKPLANHMAHAMKATAKASTTAITHML